MPSDEKHEGVVLRSIDFRDNQKIITLFTPTRGLISLIVKGINRKKTHLLTLTSPLTQGEYHFSIRRSDLYTFQDGSPLQTHHNLRNQLSHLETALTFTEALIASQYPGKPAPALYQLLLTYLKFLPKFADPSPLKASFLLKLLKHEGHLSLTIHCSHCEEPASYYALGEVYCRVHTPSFATYFSPPEWSALHILTEARSIAQLQELNLTAEFVQKIDNFFKEKI